MEALEAFAARPALMEAVLRHRNDGNIEVLREDGRALLELLGRAFDGALAFGIEHENFSGAQSVGSGAHGGHEVGIGIDRNEVQKLREAAHRSGAEDLAGSHVEDIVEAPSTAAPR